MAATSTLDCPLKHSSECVFFMVQVLYRFYGGKTELLWSPPVSSVDYKTFWYFIMKTDENTTLFLLFFVGLKSFSPGKSVIVWCAWGILNIFVVSRLPLIKVGSCLVWYWDSYFCCCCCCSCCPLAGCGRVGLKELKLVW